MDSGKIHFAGSDKLRCESAWSLEIEHVLTFDGENVVDAFC